jgi:acylphosphatase
VIRRRLVVHGRVQGVGFRVFVAARARARSVTGWVRNCSDGSVELVLEGERDAVDAVVAVCADGPRAADVSRVDVSDEEPEGLRGFELR